MTRSALPLADARSFRRAGLRTSLVRASLGALLALLLALALAVTLRGDEGRLAGLPGEPRAAVVVVDVSTSVSDEGERAIAAALRSLVAERREDGVGLVLFADVAQEALPPGTNVAELRRIVPFFEPEDVMETRADPWGLGLGTGTKISYGLKLAREALARDAGGRGTVILVSDLADSESDLPRLRDEFDAYRRALALDVRLVPLPGAQEENELLFRRSLGRERVAVDPPVAAPAAEASAPRERSAWVLAGLAVSVALVLALVELVARPLSWRAPAMRRGGA